MTSITLPETFGYVILSCVAAPCIATSFMGGPVMKARKEFNVQYPNLYATPGYHKDADAFNRVQRGHQAVLVESLPSFTLSALVAGVCYPITMSITGVAWSVGAYLFQLGYADTNLDVKMARYKKKVE
eukprot:CAMPEP_0197722540 /NCGR_PEP_ID=MMETSP1434-20131217/5188_1 /TAXON_ID=265543 /ORGANISM="Minutocellus polymorphus, Strain CCMP3303" /LENGTH=127 /DNA_ID=CAMNT_0043307707 /DNA_START=74 /DNA_END=457 /DNA_ORIENTATION=+